MGKIKQNTDLLSLPGIGPSIKKDLQDIGIKKTADLIDKNPEKLFRKLCIKQDSDIDRCVLYVFRCAVYYTNNREHDPELLKWWNWKDK